MTPEEVPAELARQAEAAWKASGRVFPDRVVRVILAAVLPRLETMVRAHIAAEAQTTMTPVDVPAALANMGVEVFEDQAHENCGPDEGCPGNTRPYHESLMREALAEILPEYGKRVREQVAEEIERTAAEEDDGSSWGGGMYRAASIARGDS